MLPLPLHCYDESGRVLPPTFLWWVLMFLMHPILIFVFAALIRDQGSQLLAWWYPNKPDLYHASLTALPALCITLCISRREQLNIVILNTVMRYLKVVLGCSIVVQAMTVLAEIVAQQGRFALSSALVLFGLGVATMFIWRSQHLSLFQQDWSDTASLPDTSSSQR